ncbi:hypothetical protein GALL_367830 [mine drainage metagenome]|uniref:Uncharacterized protein n=1 Tax=mine drainage metagenome TaxID=410659 RepID=A0A1J5QCU2_9ZZZZ
MIAMQEYEALFGEAVAFSRIRNLAIPQWPTKATPFLGDAHEVLFVEELLRLVGAPPPLGLVAGRCLPIHAALRPQVAMLTAADPVLTIGAVETTAGSTWHSCSREDVDEWLARGHPDPDRIKFHAWLTLPSMEIIDFTMMASLCAAGIIPHGGVIAREARAVQGFKYLPVAVGNDLPWRLGLTMIVGILDV